MKPILLIIAGVLMVLSIVRFIQIITTIWTEVLTLSRVFSLTWLPTLGLIVAGFIVGYYANKK